MNPAVPLTLLPALFFVWRAGRVLAGWATAERTLARLVTPAAALTLWLLTVHVVGLWARSFWVALFAGTELVAAVGLATYWLPTPDEEPAPPLGWPVFVTAALAVALLSGFEARYFLWDELLATGHLSIPLEMLNGVYPPRHLSFPVYELRYHYAFDLLTACVAALVHQPPMRWVVHGVALALWGYLAFLACGLGQRLVAPRAGPFTAACLLLAGGFFFFCGSPHVFRVWVEGHCMADGLGALPPLPSNFLQHPWSLGLPVGMAALLLFQMRRTGSLGWWVLLTGLLALLSFSQIVLFGSLGGSIALAGGLTAPGKRWKQLVVFGLWGLLLLALARGLHGFFAPVPEPTGLHLDFTPFWRGSLKEWIGYPLLSLGLMVPLGLVGFAFLKREKLTLALMCLMGFGVFSLYRYPHSWDIVKFVMIVQVGFALTAAAALWAMLTRPWWRWLAIAALPVMCAQAFLYMATADVGGYKGYYQAALDPLPTPADKRMIAYLRAHIGPGEAVWRRDTPWDYPMLGGLPVQYMDSGTATFGWSPGLWSSRQDIIDHTPPNLDAYTRQGVHWFVLGPWDVHLHTALDQWVKDGRAEARLKEPPLELFYAK